MKKVCSLLFAAVMVISLAACASAKLSEDYSEDKVIARAEEIVTVINKLDYSATCDELRDDLKSQLTAEQLKTAWDTSLTNAGAFEKYTTETAYGQKDKTTGEDYAVAVLVCKYKNASLTFTISMDKNMDIVGMYMK